VAVASAPRKLASVSFFDGKRRIASVRKGTAGLYATDWKTRNVKRGRHVLEAIVRDVKGRRATARESVRVCR
jgi:hypothetical protein